MLDIRTAQHWAASPDSLAQIRTWRWFREAVPSVVSDLAVRISTAEQPATEAVVEVLPLGRAFWAWVSVLDGLRRYEPLEPEDYAHFASGVLLVYLLRERPLHWPGASRSQEVLVLTQTAMTLLSAWRTTLGASALSDQIVEVNDAQWSSYIENITENADVAVAYLDFFTGREPRWQLPLILTERPLFARALAERHATAARS
jgi:hypothetical protein